MKAILEFDLEERFDVLAHKRAVFATDAYIALHKIDEMLREYVKYGHTISPGNAISLPEGPHPISPKDSQILNAVIEDIRGRILNITNEHVDMGDLE